MFKDKLALLITVIAMPILFSSCNEKEVAINEELFVPTEHSFKTVTLEVGDYIEENTSQAEIVFANDNELFYSGNAFFLESYVDFEDIVSKGDKIAAFYTENSVVPLEEKLLEQKRLQDSLSTITQGYNTQLRLNEEILSNLVAGTQDHTIHALNMEKSRISYEQEIYVTQNRIGVLTEEIAELREEMDIQYIFAPYDGMISYIRRLEEGDAVDPTLSIVNLMDIENMLLRLKNPKGFRYGDTVDVTIKYSKEELFLTGKVISSPIILPQEYREEAYYVAVDFSGATDNFIEDFINIYKTFNVNAEVTTVSEYVPNTLLLDRALVTKEDDKQYVNILEDGVVKKRYFTSIYNNSEYYAVVDGLSAGQEILIE